MMESETIHIMSENVDKTDVALYIVSDLKRLL